MSNSYLTQWRRLVHRTFLALIVMTAFGLAAMANAQVTDVVAINAGGPAVSNSGGGDASFVADEYFTGGGDGSSTTKTISLTQPGTNAAPMAVYQTNRAGVATYTIPNLTAGTSYTVLLHFAETYFSAKGKREFNVAINSTTVLTNLDIYATVGEYAALVESYTATATSAGNIVIALTDGAQNQPVISGIEVRGASAPTCAAVTPAPTGLAVTATTTSSISLSWTAPTPPANCTISSYVIDDGTANPPTAVAASGVTGITYTVSGLTANTTYYFTVAAVDAFGTSSASAAISGKTQTATVAPTITTQPVSQSVTAGQTATFSVVATGTPAPTYQWYENSAAISGATATSYTTPATTTSNSGETFYVVVTNSAGTVTSSTATLTVTAPPCSAVTPAPTGLTVTATTSSSISLSWTAPTPPANCTVNSYVINDGTATPPTTVAASGVTGTTYTVTGLAASTTYYFSVAAVDAYGTSPASTIISDTTSPSSNQSEIIAIHGGGGPVSNAMGGDASFTGDEYASSTGASTSTDFDDTSDIAPANAAPMQVYQTSHTGTTTYTIPGLAPGASYTVLLHFAENSDSYSPKWASPLPDPCTVPKTRIFDVLINGTTVLPDFNVYATAGCKLWTAVEETFTATANSSGQILVALSSKGSGDGGTPMISGIEIRGAASACSVAPATAPTGLAAVSNGPGAVALTWTPNNTVPNCAVSYNVYASTASGFTPSASNLVASNVNGTGFENSGLTPGGTYYYAVEAVDSVGASPASTQVSATANAATSCAAVPPAAPTGLTATSLSAHAIQLNWSAVAPQANCTNVTYNLYSGLTSGFVPSLSNQIASNLTDPTFVNTSLPPSTTVYYVVQAQDEDGASPVYSTVVSNSTIALPTTLTATATSPTEVFLEWVATTEAPPTQYDIFRSATSGFTPTTANMIGTTQQNFFEDVLASPGTQYYYQVWVGPASAGFSTTKFTQVNGELGAATFPLGTEPVFFDASNIPATPAGDAMVFKILNRTNGRYPDDQVTWSYTIGTGSTAVTTTGTVASQPFVNMPANASGRMTFYLGPLGVSSPYVDFIEYTIGANSSGGGYFINVDTTRVDAFAVKLAFEMTCTGTYPIAVGENAATFAEDRSRTFAKFIADVPAEFQQLGVIRAPYSIPEPGAGGFGNWGKYDNYYDTWVAWVWANNPLSAVTEPGPNLSGLGSYPALSAGLARHIIGANYFSSTGSLSVPGMFGNQALNYQTPPADYYAKAMHDMAINWQQYGFPYDDSGSDSSDIGCKYANDLIVAVGW